MFGEAICVIPGVTVPFQPDPLMRYSPAAVELEVRDDGKGGAQNGKPSTLQGGFGMTGMRERATNIGGTLDVTSVESQGTTVRLRVPAASEMREQSGELK